MSKTEKNLLNHCIQLIEERYYPELISVGKNLRQRDLEYLIDLIDEKSGIMISLSTMKRIWKGEFNNLPHPTTLNALVTLLDYSSWGDFKQSMQSEKSATQLESNNQRFKPTSRVIYAVLGIVLVVIVGVSAFRYEPKTEIPESILFTADKTVDVNVPNTVIFEYDLNDVQADSFFIQRSWNPLNKTELNPQNNYFSEIYYYPGFHWARLIVNETTVERERIHIQTDGWFALARTEMMQKIPTYLDQNGIIDDGIMGALTENLLASNINPEENLQLSYYNIQDFEGIDSQSFTLETRIKFESTEGLICPQFEVQLIDEIDISWYRIIQQGCESNLLLKIGENLLPGSENNFSKLGTNLNEWQEIRLQATNGELYFFLNDELAFESEYSGTVGNFMGTVLSFSGIGVVDYYKLTSHDGTNSFIYEF